MLQISSANSRHIHSIWKGISSKCRRCHAKWAVLSPQRRLTLQCWTFCTYDAHHQQLLVGSSNTSRTNKPRRLATSMLIVRFQLQNVARSMEKQAKPEIKKNEPKKNKRFSYSLKVLQPSNFTKESNMCSLVALIIVQGEYQRWSHWFRLMSLDQIKINSRRTPPPDVAWPPCREVAEEPRKESIVPSRFQPKMSNLI